MDPVASNKKYYELVGEYLSNWSMIEGYLMTIFMLATDANSGVSKRMFWEPTAFKAKIDMIDTALKGWLLRNDEELKKVWIDLKTSTTAVSVMRNTLAHGAVVDVAIGGPPETVFACYHWKKIHVPPELPMDLNSPTMPFEMLRVPDIEKALVDLEEQVVGVRSTIDKFRVA
jgi:hypothetical protein